MRYLTGASSPAARAAGRCDLGVLVQPGTAQYLGQLGDYAGWAADNGCFAGTWTVEAWRAFLDRCQPHAGSCLFATVPDVVGDHAATLERWAIFAGEVKGRGLPAAFVCQDGCGPADIPAEAEAVFIGGSTAYKLSAQARACIAEARRRGIWAHVGRVNSNKRLRWAADAGADSCDGTYLAFGPDTNLPKLLGWLDQLAAPALFEVAA